MFFHLAQRKKRPFVIVTKNTKYYSKAIGIFSEPRKPKIKDRANHRQNTFTQTQNTVTGPCATKKIYMKKLIQSKGYKITKAFLCLLSGYTVTFFPNSIEWYVVSMLGVLFLIEGIDILFSLVLDHYKQKEKEITHEPMNKCTVSEIGPFCKPSQTLTAWFNFTKEELNNALNADSIIFKGTEYHVPTNQIHVYLLNNQSGNLNFQLTAK